MGIKNLKKFINSKAKSGVLHVNPYDIFKNTMVAIDLSGYLYKFVYNEDNKARNFYLKGLTEMIFDFLKHKIIPIFIFDGKPDEAKKTTLEFRKQVHENKTTKINDNINKIAEYLKLPMEDIEKLSLDELSKIVSNFFDENVDLDPNILNEINLNLAEIAKINKTIIKLNSDIFTQTEKLFKLWNIPYLKAKGEADFLCARLSLDGIVSAVCSEDMDLLPHGVYNLITGITSLDFKKTNKTSVFVLQNILTELEITMNQFIDICILSGCDYCSSLDNIGSVKGLGLIKKYGKIEKIPEYKEIIGLDKAREQFSKHMDEKYDLKSSGFNFSKINSANLIEFLTKETSYKVATINNKLEVLRKLYS